MINAGQPVEELAEAVFGHPFHGLVRGGVLVLPNGTQMTYRQPVGGNTYVYKKPGIAVVTRSPADQITDTASGFQWRNYAILSGQDCQLYGKAIGSYGYINWIYLAADGSRWNVSMANPSIIFGAGPWIFNFTVSRFGEFGALAESYSLASTLTDIGQHIDKTSVLDRMGLATNSGGIIITTQMTSGQMVLSDVKQDGSEAIIGIDSTINPEVITQGFMPAYMGEQGLPVGFLKIALTGSGSNLAVNASVLYTRAQCMPVITAQGNAVVYDGTSLHQNFATTSNVGSTDITGRIITVWYSSAGVATPVMLNRHYEGYVGPRLQSSTQFPPGPSPDPTLDPYRFGWYNGLNWDPVLLSYTAPSDCTNHAGISESRTGKSIYTLAFGAISSVLELDSTTTIVFGSSISYARTIVGNFWQYSEIFPAPGLASDNYCYAQAYAAYLKWGSGPLTQDSSTWSSLPYAEYPTGLLPLYDKSDYSYGTAAVNELYYRRLSNRCVAIMGKHNSAGDDAILATLTPDGKSTSITLYTGAGVGTSSTLPVPGNMGLLLPNSTPQTTVDPGTTTVALDTSNNQICYV